MTTENTTETPAETSPLGAQIDGEPRSESPEAPAADGGTETLGTETPKANRDAAKYRTRLRETEAQRDALTARIEAMQLAEVHRLAGDLVEPADLLKLTETTLADYLTKNGDLDTDAVAGAVADLLETRPGLRKSDDPVDPSQGGTGKPPGRGPATWGDLLKG